MRILVVHNFYQQPGGEDEVFRTECALLSAHGHDVRTFTAHNELVDKTPRWAVARATFWNREMAHRVAEAVRDHRSDVVHFHNTFPLISPAAYSAARSAGAGVVKTLHNFRLLCANSLFFRDGKPCEKCLGRRLNWPAVAHRCYRGSRAGSAVVALMQACHHARGTWSRDIDVLITTTRFARDKFIAGGLTPDKLIVKPNFLHPAPGLGDGAGGYAMFVGRLSHEKGLATLLAAWTKHRLAIPLKVVGDGPLRDDVEAAARLADIEWLGRKPLPRVYEIIRAARILVFPSECYETFGRVAIEAFACGAVVVASNHGAPADVVEHERTGLLFAPGDSDDLAKQVKRLADEPRLIDQLRSAAREEFESRYTGERNHEQLIAIYERAIALRNGGRASGLQQQVTA